MDVLEGIHTALEEAEVVVADFPVADIRLDYRPKCKDWASQILPHPA